MTRLLTVSEMLGATVKDDTTAPTTEAADATGTTAPPQNTGSSEVDEVTHSSASSIV
jgi:hypothetical protein